MLLGIEFVAFGLRLDYDACVVVKGRSVRPHAGAGQEHVALSRPLREQLYELYSQSVDPCRVYRDLEL